MPQLPVPPQNQKPQHNYVDSLWCSYLVSVAASWVAELGELEQKLLLPINNIEYKNVINVKQFVF